MDYSKFINAVIKQDNRNSFSKSYCKIANIDKGFEEFYNQYVPIDVEIVLSDLTSIKLYDVEQFDELRQNYNLNNEHIVFATREGDPIALYQGKIITFNHSAKDPIFEIIADSFEKYIVDILENMQ